MAGDSAKPNQIAKVQFGQTESLANDLYNEQQWSQAYSINGGIFVENSGVLQARGHQQKRHTNYFNNLFDNFHW